SLVGAAIIAYTIKVFKFLCLLSFCTFLTFPSVASSAAASDTVSDAVREHLLLALLNQGMKKIT
ncbi:hypothetical protein N0Y54_29335, partial [Nostoc punctiforme UO1]